MAEEEKKEKENSSSEESAPKKPNKMMKIVGIVGGALALQAIGVFIAVKVVGKGPADAVAIEAAAESHNETVSEHHETEINPNEATGELKVATLECPHTNTGRLYVIRMTVYASVPQSLMGEASQGKEGGGGGGHGASKEAKEGEHTAPTVPEEVEKKIATIKDRMRTVIASADAGTLCLAHSEKPDYGLSTLRRQFKTILDDVLGKGKIKDILISDYMPTPMD
jgi:flagellar basal body-associated protein FliL